MKALDQHFHVRSFSCLFSPIRDKVMATEKSNSKPIEILEGRCLRDSRRGGQQSALQQEVNMSAQTQPTPGCVNTAL